MADIALDADGLRRDRQRYHRLLEQAEQQIAAWNERADHLQQAIDGLDRLMVLAGDDPARDGGVAQGTGGPPERGKRDPVPVRGAPPTPTAQAPAAAPGPPARKAAAPKKTARARAAKKPLSPTATPAAREPVAPPADHAAEAPKGTDALRLVFESAPGSTWSLAELIDALGDKGWLPTSRRPEEGVRISLKRLAERGGAVRTDDGRWRLPLAGEAGGEEAPQPEPAEGRWPEAETPPAPTSPAAHATPAADEPAVDPPPAPEPRSASFGRPVGGTITEL